MGELSKITSKGQVTLPKGIRDKMGLLIGDELMFTVVGNRIVVTPKNLSFADLAGLLGDPPSGRLSLEQIDAGISRGVYRDMTGDDEEEETR